jgi:hypothetical protein
MMVTTTEKTILTTAGLVLAGLLLVPVSTGAEEQAKDRPMIGPQTERQKVAPSPGTPQRSESMTGELGKTTETPMKAPEGGEGISMQPLLTPTVSDFLDARESDLQSALGF